MGAQLETADTHSKKMTIGGAYAEPSKAYTIVLWGQAELGRGSI
jgi:hypothetical protein